MDTTAVAQSVSNNPTFGQLAGYALLLLVLFVGFSLLYNGWPEFRKKK